MGGDREQGGGVAIKKEGHGVEDGGGGGGCGEGG